MTSPHPIAEKPLLKTLRILTGIMLAIQGVAFFFVSCFSVVMILLVGSLAFLSDGSDATNEQVKATGLMLLVMLFYPFAWTFMIVLSAINVLLRKRPVLIIILCALSILSEIGIFAYLRYMNESSLESFTISGQHAGLKVVTLSTMLIPLAGIIVAAMMRRGR